MGWIMLARILLFVACFFMIGDVARAADEETFTEIYSEMSLRMPTTSLIVACHGFSCRNQAQIILSSSDRARLATLLAAGKSSPAAERRAVAGAVQWFDRRIGPVAGTTKRIARAGVGVSGDPGQMDCIDVSTNNTSLLLVLAQLRLLVHHRPELPVSRGFLLDGRFPHMTAVLSEIKTGQRWSFDNWTRNYGELPDVTTLEEWRVSR
jgi:hypothetical protein